MRKSIGNETVRLIDCPNGRKELPKLIVRSDTPEHLKIQILSRKFVQSFREIGNFPTSTMAHEGVHNIATLQKGMSRSKSAIAKSSLQSEDVSGLEAEGTDSPLLKRKSLAKRKKKVKKLSVYKKGPANAPRVSTTNTTLNKKANTLEETALEAKIKRADHKLKPAPHVPCGVAESSRGRSKPVRSPAASTRKGIQLQSVTSCPNLLPSSRLAKVKQANLPGSKRIEPSPRHSSMTKSVSRSPSTINTVSIIEAEIRKQELREEAGKEPVKKVKKRRRKRKAKQKVETEIEEETDTEFGDDVVLSLTDSVEQDSAKYPLTPEEENVRVQHFRSHLKVLMERAKEKQDSPDEASSIRGRQSSSKVALQGKQQSKMSTEGKTYEALGLPPLRRSRSSQNYFPLILRVIKSVHRSKDYKLRPPPRSKTERVITVHKK